MAGLNKVELINFISLFILYFVQAMPYGFQSRYLPIVMRKNGLSITSLGFYKLLLVPWICKIFIAAFLIDVYKTKRFWLISSMIVLTIGSFIGALFHDNFAHLAFIIFMLNCASAFQDICVDWFSMNALKEEDLGIGNTIQVGAFKLGTLFSGGLLVYLSDYTNVSINFIILGFVYLISLVLINVTFLNMESDDKVDKKENDKNDLRCNSKLTLKQRIILLNEAPGTYWMCLFVIIYKLGEQSSLNLIPIYLVDNKVSSSKIGLWTGIYGQSFSILGSFLSGVLLKMTNEKTPSVTWLKYTLILRNIPIVLISYLIVSIQNKKHILNNLNTVQLDDSSLYCILYLVIVQLFLSGFLTTICFTLMMQVSFKSQKCIQATHFSLLATFEVFGKLLIQPFISMFCDYYGYSASFILFSILYLACLLIFKYHPNFLLKLKTSSSTKK